MGFRDVLFGTGAQAYSPGSRAREAVVGPLKIGPTTLSTERHVMARTLIAISVVTAAVLVTAFGVTMAVSYTIHERCTDQMAQQGDC